MQPIPPLPIRVPPSFRTIAHRGASAYAPENTLPAFELAEGMGVLDVELDTQLTTDGVVAICHDTTLARYGHGDWIVEEMSWAELASLDMGSWFSPFLFGGEHMTRLDQLFDHFGDRLVYHIELKGRAPGLAAAVHAQIEQHGLAESCFITSFSYESLVAMRKKSSSARLGWLVRGIDDDVLTKANALGLHQLCPQAAVVTAEMVTAARRVVTNVRAWGIQGTHVSQHPAEVIALIERVRDAGCDGATINWPDWIATLD
ncbi:MAG: hypothetical protein KDD84_01450 [Caldilineaceae bacterium]|nr:hypothetical protein [Caldilineaceae bacterium]